MLSYNLRMRNNDSEYQIDRNILDLKPKLNVFCKHTYDVMIYE